MEKDLNGTERRKLLLEMIQQSKEPLSGKKLGELCGVTRQVIVTDIAILRSSGHDIISTPKGYLLNQKAQSSYMRVFKVRHGNDQMEEELKLIVDAGGIVQNVMINHRAYGILSAQLLIKSRRDIKNFINDVTTGKSTLLCNVTSGYHFHTVLADSEIVLNEIEEALREHGFLTEILSYEKDLLNL